MHQDSLSVFDFKSLPVRVITIDKQPWFVAKDVAEVLGHTDPSMMLKHVDEDDKQVINPQKLESVRMTESFGSNTFKVSIINESGLYACIFNSTKPEAKKFKKWVTSEVLPEIRKTNSYSLNKQEYTIPKTYAEALFEAGRLALENDKLTAKIKKDAPLVAYAEAVRLSDDSVDFNSFAKMINTGEKRLFCMMREAGVIMQNSTLPYQRFIDSGYFKVSQEILANGKLIPSALVTGKGQLWLKQRLDSFRKTEQNLIKSIAQIAMF